MKRDLDLIRDILFRMEEMGSRQRFDAHFEGYDDELVQYHLYLLVNAELIEAHEVGGATRDLYMPTKITWEGQEFLANARNSTVWSKVKNIVKERGGDASFTVLKALLTQVAMKAMGV